MKIFFQLLQHFLRGRRWKFWGFPVQWLFCTFKQLNKTICQGTVSIDIFRLFWLKVSKFFDKKSKLKINFLLVALRVRDLILKNKLLIRIQQPRKHYNDFLNHFFYEFLNHFLETFFRTIKNHQQVVYRILYDEILF